MDRGGTPAGPTFGEVVRYTTRSGQMAESIEYGGMVWRRYPNSRFPAARYFVKRVGKRPDAILLHRRIYEDFVGPIPKGMAIHHKDGCITNNHPSNLELCTFRDHSQKHVSDNVNMRQGLREWRQKQPGQLRQIAKNASDAYWSDPRVVSLTCSHCGIAFSSKDVRTNRKRYCSGACNRQALRTEKRLCKHCGQEFLAASFEPNVFCSKRCSACYGGILLRNRRHVLHRD